ncbi:hypothetical protein RclHR1_22940001 [Rhizophagus clarus]|uniref:Uncharacterized protein n=1 Tax=Rhizophagus clarus TaxID=94130 RepID=A0A2Z6QUZ8_9GLOM|nr:hypothetical protein RclHR1_22940001 [Rhizophagus clarus]
MVFRRSRTPLEADRYFEGLEVLYRQTTVSPEEVDRVISKAQNSNLKRIEVFRRSAVGFLEEILKIELQNSFLIRRFANAYFYRFAASWNVTKLRRFTASGRVSGQDFKDLEPLLRQTSYLKAHGFPDANKRWEKIKVRGKVACRNSIGQYQMLKPKICQNAEMPK